MAPAPGKRTACQPRLAPLLQELEKCETDVLECDSQAACLYVNEPKTKVDLTKYIERHTFRWVLLRSS